MRLEIVSCDNTKKINTPKISLDIDKKIYK